MKKAFLVLGLIALILVSGCTQGLVTLPDEECEQECELPKQVEPVFTFGEVGDNVIDARAELNVESFEVVSEFNERESIQKFVVVNFSVKNIADNTFSLNSKQFQLVFERGQEREKYIAFNGFSESFIDLKNIQPNETRQGFLIFEVRIDQANKELNFVLTDKENGIDFGGTLVRLKPESINLVLSGSKNIKSSEDFIVSLDLINPKNIETINLTIAFEKDKLAFGSLLVDEAFEVVKRVNEFNFFEFVLKPRNQEALNEDSHLINFTFKPRKPGLSIVSINDSDLISSDGEYLSHLQFNHVVWAQEG